MTLARPIVIGAGPAGSAAAIYLLRAKARPIIYERREAVGDALCGGFLSWSTLRRLEDLGITGDVLEGHAIGTLRLTAGEREWQFPLPQAAMGVSRSRLDGCMLELAQSLGAELRHETVHYSEGSFRTRDGTALRADSIFLAVGKHDLRGMPRDREGLMDDPFLGLRVRFAPSPALLASLCGVIEMHLFDGGYAGLVLQEGGQANLCMALRKSRLGQAGGSPEQLFSQLAQCSGLLGRRMASLARPARVDAIGHVPYGWRARDTCPGLFRIGDQAGVIPSLAGEGIGIALASARLAIDAWQSDGPAGSRSFQRDFASRLHSRLMLAGLASKAGTSGALAAWLGIAASIPGIPGLIGRLTRI